LSQAGYGDTKLKDNLLSMYFSPKLLDPSLALPLDPSLALPWLTTKTLILKYVKDILATGVRPLLNL